MRSNNAYNVRDDQFSRKLTLEVCLIYVNFVSYQLAASKRSEADYSTCENE